mgnify:CR=1 FL=1
MPGSPSLVGRAPGNYTKPFEKIVDATNGKIEDYHFSFKGHNDFANMMYDKIQNRNLI